MMVHFLKKFDSLKEQLKDKRLALFLDYDGTLTPIVERPELAILAPKTKELLKILAQCPSLHIFIVSGRSMKNVKELVDIPGITYMGNHGLEVEGSGINFENFSFLRFREILEYLRWEITKELVFFRGAFIEDKGLGLSVHYRLLSEKDEAIFKTFLEVITREFFNKREIRITPGKKVFEIRPPLNWNKGKAVELVLSQISKEKGEIFPLYLGDDTTDEDAFLALKDSGVTVYVGYPGHAEHSMAGYYLNNTDEVVEFLEYLVALHHE